MSQEVSDVIIGFGSVIVTNNDDEYVEKIENLAGQKGLQTHHPLEGGVPNIFITFKGKNICKDISDAYGEYQLIPVEQLQPSPQEISKFKEMMSELNLSDSFGLLLYVYND